MKFNKVSVNQIENSPDEAWVDDKNLFLVQRFSGKCERLTINRQSYTKFREKIVWDEGITWDELQEIKDSLGYQDKWMVEVHPPKKHIVNDANMRHLWLLDKDPKYGWRNE